MAKRKADAESFRDWCRALAMDKSHRDWYAKVWRDHPGQVTDKERALIYAYAFGKPRETVALEGADGGPVAFTIAIGAATGEE